MLPSILSLAFPRENPCLNRTSAAIIPVFILAGSGLVYCYKKISSTLKNGFQRWIFIFCTGFLLLLTCSLNFQLVFNEFNKQFMEKAWNSSEMGNVIKDFVKNGGDPNLAFVVPYPYWVDTRLVGINAGYPTKDYALKPEQIIQTKWLPEPKIFIVYPEDNRAMQEVQGIYPNSRVEIFNSKQPGKKFIIVRVG